MIDPESDAYPSEDESEVLEAMAQFDFNARSSRELSLTKGDCIILRKQVSNDWWQGSVNGKEGLVPDKYISLKLKDEVRLPAQNSQSMEHLYLENSCSSSTSMLVDNKDIAKYVVNDVYFNNTNNSATSHANVVANANAASCSSIAHINNMTSTKSTGGGSSCSSLTGSVGGGNGSVSGGYSGGNNGIGSATTTTTATHHTIVGGGGVSIVGVSGGINTSTGGDSSTTSTSCLDGAYSILTNDGHLHTTTTPPPPPLLHYSTAAVAAAAAHTSTTIPAAAQQILSSTSTSINAIAAATNHSLIKFIKNKNKQYHDEPHSFENAIEFQNAYDEQIEKFETTV